jgi:hypothetical protein
MTVRWAGGNSVVRKAGDEHGKVHDAQRENSSMLLDYDYEYACEDMKYTCPAIVIQPMHTASLLRAEGRERAIFHACVACMVSYNVCDMGGMSGEAIGRAHQTSKKAAVPK